MDLGTVSFIFIGPGLTTNSAVLVDRR